MQPIPMPFRHVSVRDAVSSLLARYEKDITRQGLRIDLDIESGTDGFICNRNLYDTVERLLALAIDRCPVSTELAITVIGTSRGLEIEIADSGSQTETSATYSKFAAFAPQALSRFPSASRVKYLFDSQLAFNAREDSNSHADYEVYCVRCPQGGLAWSVVTKSRQYLLRTA